MSDGYTLDKTTAGYSDSTTNGNDQLGMYTLDGMSGSTSTAIETQGYGTYGATFTEILSQGGTSSEFGNDGSGDYDKSTWGEKSADFVDDGTNVTGTFQIDEGSTGTFSSSEDGNYDSSGYVSSGA